MESDRIGHIDSPETSENTEALHGESLIDDMSSVLGHDILGALQDNTITEDTTTICALERPKKRSLKKKLSSGSQKSKPHTETTTHEQFGFENMVFDIDNRLDNGLDLMVN